MNVQHLTLRDFVRQPWKNGGGFTTELAEHVEGYRWLWRLSVAEIEHSGPFSEFNGYERTIMLLEGDGIELIFDCAPGQRIVRPDVPFVFDGERKTHCRLVGGPVRALNVIVDRERARASVETVLLDAPAQRPISTPWMLVYSLRGRVVVECDRASTSWGVANSRASMRASVRWSLSVRSSRAAPSRLSGFNVSEERNRCT